MNGVLGSYRSHETGNVVYGDEGAAHPIPQELCLPQRFDRGQQKGKSDR